MKTILVLLDTLNRRYLKTYGKHAKGITPNMDRFAEDCVVYDNHFIGSAPCMPARRDIFTGRMQFLERGWGGVEPFDITLLSRLREKGIFTHITTDHTHYFEIGGENYCYLFNTWDYHRGQEFDTWISRVRQPPVDCESYGKKSSQYLLNKTTFVSEEEYPSPRTFRSACEWVENNKGCDDFFLMVESFDPHEPFDCPEKYHRMYQDTYSGREFCWPSYAKVTEPADAVEHLEKCYLGTLSMADYWFGKLLDTLKKNGMYEDTLLIFTTDHGHMLGEHGFTGKNIMHAYNEMAHIPLMIHFPGNEGAGQRVKALTQNIDIMPTILQHHGCDIPDRVKGKSLRDIRDGIAAPREQVIYGWFGRAVNVYDGRYTYFRAPASVENSPLYQYCGMPSTCWRYFDERYAERMEMGRFLPYTRYPVYRIPALYPEDYSGNIELVMQSLLFDLETDYAQLHPLKEREIETDICRKLTAGMREAQAPEEQYRRLGLNGSGG